MKYTIELTNKQKAQMDCMMEIVHRYVGFNPKLEPMETTNIEDTGEYQFFLWLRDAMFNGDCEDQVFCEICCRKLVKLGYVEADGGYYRLIKKDYGDKNYEIHDTHTTS